MSQPLRIAACALLALGLTAGYLFEPELRAWFVPDGAGRIVLQPGDATTSGRPNTEFTQEVRLQTPSVPSPETRVRLLGPDVTASEPATENGPLPGGEVLPGVLPAPHSLAAGQPAALRTDEPRQ